jgi:hypothetical protein
MKLGRSKFSREKMFCRKGLKSFVVKDHDVPRKTLIVVPGTGV